MLNLPEYMILFHLNVHYNTYAISVWYSVINCAHSMLYALNAQ